MLFGSEIIIFRNMGEGERERRESESRGERQIFNRNDYIIFC